MRIETIVINGEMVDLVYKSKNINKKIYYFYALALNSEKYYEIEYYYSSDKILIQVFCDEIQGQKFNLANFVKSQKEYDKIAQLLKTWF